MAIWHKLWSQSSTLKDIEVAGPATFSVGVTIPARNEEKTIGDVVCRLKGLGYNNVLVVDGHSDDTTITVAENSGAKVVLQHGKGKGNAIRQVLGGGYIDADILVLMDADGLMAPEEVPVLIERLCSGADLVKGSRFLKGGKTYDMGLVRRIGNRLLMTAVNLFWSAEYTDLCYGFFVLNRRAIVKLAPLLKSENFEIEAEIFINALKLGLIVNEVPSIEFKRKNGASNLNTLKDGLKIFRTIVREYFISL